MGALEATGRITAVLGPTNTGKTHLAIERMLGHASGMIGFPLRLLARENYDRIVRLKGARAVALITGEERILPPNPSHYVCTVEAMPLDLPVDFLAVDEIQLAGDPERGHVFTDRLLKARGRYETMFMGSDTIRPLLKRLVPDAVVIARPRFSTLTYTGPRKVTRLPPRSAVVAFAVADVFEIAELVRRQRGGTAVVLGALSPRARNAQVAMYQAGEVDYMVATDAIGMGLNMDLDHVAFARLTKFDGRQPRRLTPAELAQIAGRAGRHMNDGSFGTTFDAGSIEPELVEAIEAHRFDPLTALWWRNSALNFRSAPLLLRSLEERPPWPFLLRSSTADDQQALEALARLPDIAARATNPAMVRLLWEVCQIPDFRKVMSEHHARLLTQIFRYLSSGRGRLPVDWVAAQIARLDRVEGDIDTLVGRIAHIRSWTYITHRSGWIDQAEHWQERARAIEDKLSDALHDRLTQRFVDRRSAVLVRQLAEATELNALVSAQGDVSVEGHYVGQIRGFQFRPDQTATGDEIRMLLVAANRVLRGEIQARSRRLAAETDEAFVLTSSGQVLWHAAPVAKLIPGDQALTPRIEVLPADFLDGGLRETVRRRLDQFIRATIAHELAVLLDTEPAGFGSAKLGPAGRGLLFRLGETLGTLDSDAASALLRTLPAEDRRVLAGLGIRFGTETLYVDALLKPMAVALRGLLWSVFRGHTLPAPKPEPGWFSAKTTLFSDEAMLDGPSIAAYGDAIGYRVVGPRAIRLDRLERLAAALRRRARDGRFTLDEAIAGSIAAPMAEMPAILQIMGYRAVVEAEQTHYVAQPRRARKNGQARRRVKAERPPAPDHPFALLREFGRARG